KTPPTAPAGARTGTASAAGCGTSACSSKPRNRLSAARERRPSGRTGGPSCAIRSTALAVAAIQAGGAAVHDDGGLGVALVAHGGAGREAGALAGDGHGLVAARLRAGLGLLVAGLVGGALLGDQPLLLLAQLRVDDHADGLEVL